MSSKSLSQSKNPIIHTFQAGGATLPIILVVKYVVTDPESMNRCVTGYREKCFMQNSGKDI